MLLLWTLLSIGSAQQDSYDFIVVGAGLGGAVVASQLSASPNHSVLLVEAGDFPVFPQIEHLADFFDAWANPNVAHNFNSTPQPGLANQTQNLRRAAVGGGCTQINAGVWFLGDRRIFDHWETLGNVGWGFASMAPYLQAANQAFSGRVSQGMQEGPFLEMLKAAGAEQSYKWLPNPNLANSTSDFGMSPRFLSAWVPEGSPPNTKGFRATSWSQFLPPEVLRRPNLDVLTWSQVTSLHFSTGSVAVDGVHIVNRQTGREVDVKSTREVIVCGGPFETPKLLQLSGIGDAKALAGVGVKAVVDLPGVGQNLQDHLYLPLVSPPFLNQSTFIPFDAFGQTGVIAYPSLGANLTNYYLAAMPLVDEASQLKASSILRHKSDADILKYIQTAAHSDYHYAGTCKMGADDDALAVVNGELLVRGVSNLRIVDGSVLPVLPPGNPQLHTYMVALKAVDMIKKTHKIH